MSRGKRLGVLLSGVWLVACHALYSESRPFKWQGFLLVGVGVVALAWGVAWVIRGPRRPG